MSGIQSANGILEDIAAEIGYTATTALVDWFGGTSLYIPQIVTEGHVIERTIGMPAMRRLVQCYGNEVINMPIDYRRERNQRNRLIGALIAKGVGVDEVARISGVSQKQIGHVRRDLESAGLIPYILNSQDMLLIEPESVAEMKEFEVLFIEHTNLSVK